MKISASIYSQKDEALRDVILRLDEHGIDFYHIDCNDDERVFDDITTIRSWGSKPVDLHIITDHPQKYYPLLEKNPVDFLTFQYENLKERIQIPKNITGKKGLAITSDTDISVFDDYKADFDFILIMATTPGKSGGRFDKKNFQKIRQFKKLYPNKKIHVDGGVNAEVSFILRNSGVYSAVSGSFLFKSSYLGAAVLNLKGERFQSNYLVRDIMIPLEESPILKPQHQHLPQVLQCLEDYGLGLAILCDDDGTLQGIITNADLRRGLLAALPTLAEVDVKKMINATPFKINENQSVSEMLRLIKAQKFPISYLPVVNNQGKVAGTITFFNLIKGEL